MSASGEPSQLARAAEDTTDGETSLGLGGSRVEGRSLLVRKRKNGVIVDTWSEPSLGIDVKLLARMLLSSKAESEYDLTSFVKSIEYQGFDREFYVKHALSKMSVSVFVRFAIIGAIRGSKFDKIANSCDSMPADLISAYSQCSFVSATPKKKVDITILRNTASIPHWCSFWMLKSNVQKKISDVDCHSCLQFPGAASLPMSYEVRAAHIEFCSRFSALLPGGKFNVEIYKTAASNLIDVKEIPQEVIGILKVSSTSESALLSDEMMEPYTRALTVRSARK